MNIKKLILMAFLAALPISFSAIAVEVAIKDVTTADNSDEAQEIVACIEGCAHTYNQCVNEAQRAAETFRSGVTSAALTNRGNLQAPGYHSSLPEIDSFTNTMKAGLTFACQLQFNTCSAECMGADKAE